MDPNPFYYNLPTTPEDLVGRWTLVDEIVTNLSNPVPESWGVIGGRRFGKSSVLNAIQSRLELQLAHCTRGKRHILPLLVDLQGCGETKTVESVYACLVRRLVKVLHHSSTLAIDLSGTGLHAFHEAENLSFKDFEKTINKLVEYFKEHHGPLRLVLLLDEVETATRFTWCETLFNSLRSLVSNPSRGNTVKLVLTGSARIIQIHQIGSPLLNILEIRHMNLFSASDLQQLMARGGQMPSQAAAAVQTTSGGHPFIAQYLLHHLWNLYDGLAQATPLDIEKYAHKMLREHYADMSGWWDAIGESGQKAYMVLAKQEEWISERTLIKQCHSTNVDRGLAALCYHGLVTRNESWPPRYRVAGSLFRDWFFRNVKKPDDNDVLTFPEHAELVQYLLDIPLIADRDRRRTVISQLSTKIKSNVDYDSTDRVHVFNMVNTCLQYSGGMQELRDILEFFEGKSIPMQRFEEALNRLLPRG